MANDGKLDRTSKGPGLERPQGEFGLEPAVKHETSAIELGPIVKSVAAIVIIAIISHIVIYLLYSYWIGREETADRTSSPVMEIPITNDSPKLQVDEQAALATYERRTADDASRYAWVDQNAGVARIPIERAMEIVGQSGRLPAGENWSLRPGEQMVGGVIMTPEQVAYANTPPSQAAADQAPAPLRQAAGAAPQPAAPQPAAPQPAAPQPAPTNPRR
jgi:hypothetical protein